MSIRAAPRISLVSTGLGVVAVVLSLYVIYRSHATPPPPNNVDNAGFSVILLLPLAIVGGVLVAHGIYRYNSPEEVPTWWLLFYPLAAGGAVAIVDGFRLYVRDISSNAVVELIFYATVAGSIAAGVVRLIDRSRR